MAKNQMSITEALALPVAVDLETAGRAHGIGRTKSHELARAGEFPCEIRRLGNQYRVTRADLLRSLGIQAVEPLVEAGHPRSTVVGSVGVQGVVPENSRYVNGGGEAA